MLTGLCLKLNFKRIQMRGIFFDTVTKGASCDVGHAVRSTSYMGAWATMQAIGQRTKRCARRPIDSRVSRTIRVLPMYTMYSTKYEVHTLIQASKPHSPLSLAQEYCRMLNLRASFDKVKTQVWIRSVRRQALERSFSFQTGLSVFAESML